MKKIIITAFILFIIPITVSANIICNDGTESPTCQNCHTGCCSGHHGCIDNPNNNSHKNSNIVSKKEKKSGIGLSKVDFILILLLLLPWVIAILTSIFDFFKGVAEVIINKRKQK